MEKRLGDDWDIQPVTVNKVGVEWAVNNQTHLYKNGWFHYAKLYAALAGCIGFMMIKYEWGIGKKQWFRAFPFVIVAINILIQ